MTKSKGFFTAFLAVMMAVLVVAVVGCTKPDEPDNGGGDNDTIYGEGGNDKIKGGSGDDCISGGDGNDKIEGNNGKSYVKFYIVDNRVNVGQMSDDDKGATLAYATTVGSKQKGSKTELAAYVGTEIAKKAKKAKISKVVFDRGSRLYAGA